MAQLTIRINGYAYTVACEDGQEAHLQEMAAEVERRIESIKALGAQSGESKLLVLASLLLADELHDLRAQQRTPAPAPTSRRNTRLVQTVEQLADRAERIATELERH